MNLTQMRAALGTITGITTESILDRAVVQAVAELSRSRPLLRVYSEQYEESLTQIGTGFADGTVIQLAHAPLRLNTPPTISVTPMGEAMAAILDISNVYIDYHRARITVVTDSYDADTAYNIQYTRDGLRVDFEDELGLEPDPDRSYRSPGAGCTRSANRHSRLRGLWRLYPDRWRQSTTKRTIHLHLLLITTQCANRRYI